MVGFAKILCLVAVASSLASSSVIALETCRAAMDWCRSGTNAGCDTLEALACQDGRSCEAPLSVCKGGSIGPGTCYDAEKYVCDLGRIRERGTRGDVVHSSG
jgi:hypothetical protein